MTDSSSGNAFSQADTDSSPVLANIRFSPNDGRIWLGENRMLLIHAAGFGVLRRELIDSIGAEPARGLLTRMGYHNGAHDAQLVRNLPHNGEDPVSFMLMGPQLHMLEGTGAVIPVRTDFDEESGHFDGEYLWKDSAEAEAHLKNYGLSSTPACWMQIGYASGFVSSYMGKPILFREVECIAQGAECCRIIGKPADEWTGAEHDLQFMRADALTSGLSVPNTQQVAPFGQADEEPANPLGIAGVVGVSAGFNAACHKLRRVADTQATVLFLGESGVGKEVFARSLHTISPRAEQPFVAVNCAAIPDNLVEAELFGVERGAFTGATSTRAGRFERANGGTILLDEIGILNSTAQGKLLRVLQEREVERVGGGKTIAVDVRVIAATNLDLKKEVEAGRFREDLYYRLNVFPITVPSLRERLEDIPVFMNHFLRKYSRLHQRPVAGFTSRAINAMLSYKWPGNIRELENIVERGVIMAAKNGAIDNHHLFTGGEELDSSGLTLSREGALVAQSEQHANDNDQLGNQVLRLLAGIADPAETTSLSAIEVMLIRKTLQMTGGNKAAAARLLGLSRSQLIYRLNNKGQ